MVDLTGYRLTFDDEFNTRSISSTGAGTTYADTRAEWRTADGTADTGFGRSSFVDPASGYDPFSVRNGILSITAVPDRTPSGVPGSWESGLITTQGNFSQTYGYFEIRADFSNDPNAWDAFWLLPNQQSAQSSSTNGHQELDVVEHYGNGDRSVYSTIHTTDPQNGIRWQDNRQVVTELNDPSGYHTYGMNWQPDKISFYVDGQLADHTVGPAQPDVSAGQPRGPQRGDRNRKPDHVEHRLHPGLFQQRERGRRAAGPGFLAGWVRSGPLRGGGRPVDLDRRDCFIARPGRGGRAINRVGSRCLIAGHRGRRVIAGASMRRIIPIAVRSGCGQFAGSPSASQCRPGARSVCATSPGASRKVGRRGRLGTAWVILRVCGPRSWRLPSLRARALRPRGSAG